MKKIRSREIGIRSEAVINIEINITNEWHNEKQCEKKVVFLIAVSKEQRRRKNDRQKVGFI